MCSSGWTNGTLLSGLSGYNYLLLREGSGDILIPKGGVAYIRNYTSNATSLNGNIGYGRNFNFNSNGTLSCGLCGNGYGVYGNISPYAVYGIV